MRRRIQALAGGADPVNIDRWWASAAPDAQRLTLLGAQASARLAATYLAQHAAIERVRVEPIRTLPDRAQIETSLHVTGPVAFKTHIADSGGDVAESLLVMGTRLAASSLRLVLAGSRDTIMTTVAESSAIRGWRRITAASPCFFCSMLASRGAVYSETGGDFQVHDGDQCSIEPLYRRESEPDDVRELQAQWRLVTAGTSGHASVLAWRRYWTAAQPG